MPSTIFYSWQSDLPNSTNRGFIQVALENAAKAIREDDSIQVEPVVDRDTAGVPGSPDIAATIFDKIEKCDAFVCDVSITNTGTGGRPTPNPNVLIELGYAIKKLGWQRIIMVMNTAFGAVPNLPFDLRMKRVLPYDLQNGQQEKASERKRLSATFEQALRLIFQIQNDNPQEILPTVTLPPDHSWRDAHRAKALEEYSKGNFSIYMEIFTTPAEPWVRKTPADLLQAASKAVIHTFGWPIGVMNSSNREWRPKPLSDGIVNVLSYNDSFDYWAIRTDGAFYLLKSLFEEKQEKDVLFFDTRIVRTTEVLLYLGRLWEGLQVSQDAIASVAIRYVGLSSRLGTGIGCSIWRDLQLRTKLKCRCKLRGKPSKMILSST